MCVGREAVRRVRGEGPVGEASAALQGDKHLFVRIEATAEFHSSSSDPSVRVPYSY